MNERDMSLAKLPKNVWVIAICQILSFTGAPLMILIGGILGAAMAPLSTLSTLPITASIVSTATFTIPAVLLMQRIGRKKGIYIGFVAALMGYLLAFGATLIGNFWLLIGATVFMGINIAFTQQMRFAAIESVGTQKEINIVLSLLMVCGIFAAFIGPELGMLGENLIESPYGFAGSFLLVAGLIVLAMIVFSQYEETFKEQEEIKEEPRKLVEVVKSPYFKIAIIASAVGYAVMSLVMTATPVNMTQFCGISLNSSKVVIQVHIASMFLPSLFTGVLMNRFGMGKILLTGSLIYLGMMLFALSGEEVVHFSSSLILLGVGWNFLFITGTALLPKVYKPSERFKTQGTHDFVVFGCQAAGSLGAGWLLYSFGWNTLIWICLPMVILAVGAGVWLIRLEKRMTNHQKNS